MKRSRLACVLSYLPQTKRAIDMKYEWTTYSQGFTVAATEEAKYGKRQLPSGRAIWVNYGRELKNGKGLTIIDRLKDGVLYTESAMRRSLAPRAETPTPG
jgi:hypothetical protein